MEIRSCRERRSSSCSDAPFTPHDHARSQRTRRRGWRKGMLIALARALARAARRFLPLTKGLFPMRFRHFVVLSSLAVLSVPACTSSDPTPSGCTKDTDCSTGRICGTEGRCIDRATSPTESEPDACTTDAQCKHLCVAGRCAECRTDDDCMKQGSCYPDGRGNANCASAPCVYEPSPVDRSPWVTCDTTTNTCKCTGFYRSGLSCTCEWR